MADETSLNGAPNNGAPDVFVATYHDTADRRLARAHIALRRRQRNGTGLWEAEIGGEVLSAPGGPATLPAELALRLTAPLRNRKLEEVVRLRTGTEDVALLEGQHVLRSYATLDSALRDTVTPTRVPRTRKRAPAIEHVRTYLRAQVAEIERTDPLIRSGDDPDALHDFRVAVRRMRSVLKSTTRRGSRPCERSCAGSAASLPRHGIWMFCSQAWARKPARTSCRWSGSSRPSAGGPGSGRARRCPASAI